MFQPRRAPKERRSWRTQDQANQEEHVEESAMQLHYRSSTVFTKCRMTTCSQTKKTSGLICCTFWRNAKTTERTVNRQQNIKSFVSNISKNTNSSRWLMNKKKDTYRHLPRNSISGRPFASSTHIRELCVRSWLVGSAVKTELNARPLKE